MRKYDISASLMLCVAMFTAQTATAAPCNYRAQALEIRETPTRQFSVKDISNEETPRILGSFIDQDGSGGTRISTYLSKLGSAPYRVYDGLSAVALNDRGDHITAAQTTGEQNYFLGLDSGQFIQFPLGHRVTALDNSVRAIGTRFFFQNDEMLQQAVAFHMRGDGTISMEDLPVDGRYSQGLAASPAGIAVGRAYNPNGTWRLDATGLHVRQDGAGVFTPRAVNSAGQVLGQLMVVSNDGPIQVAAIWNGQMTLALSSAPSFGMDINENGDSLITLGGGTILAKANGARVKLSAAICPTELVPAGTTVYGVALNKNGYIAADVQSNSNGLSVRSIVLKPLQ